MSLSAAKNYFQDRLKTKAPNAEVDHLLSAKTLAMLRTVGLPDDVDGDFIFDQHMTLLENQLVQVGLWGRSTALCLDLTDGEALIYSGGADVGTGFLNSGVEEFTLCLYEFENYLTNIQSTPAFGSIHGSDAENSRAKGAAYLQERFMAIDPAVFERGYYWPSFIEQIGVGGI